MTELSDAKLERFARELLINYAAGMPRSKAATDAARKAGYRGSSLEPNARKRAGRSDVKARMAELAAPALAKLQDELITPTVEGITRRLLEIASPKLAPEATKVSDQIQAMRTICQIHGLMAPEKHAVTVSHEDALNELDDEPGEGNPPVAAG